jgi:hypothetical protein
VLSETASCAGTPRSVQSTCSLQRRYSSRRLVRALYFLSHAPSQLSNAVKPEWRFIFFLSRPLHAAIFCIVSVRQPINFLLYNSTVLFTPHRIPLGHKYSTR